MLSPLEQFNIVRLWKLVILHVDISLCNVIIPLIILILLTLLIVYFLYNNSKIIPNNLVQYLTEELYKFLVKIINQQIGKKGIIYLPLIFSIFFFILFENIVSLFPFGIAITSHLILNLYLSLMLCTGIFIVGLINNSFKYFKIFIPNCPFILLPIMIPIEIFSYIIRMFSLGIRLTANILAGHTLVFIVSSFILKIITEKIVFFFFLIIPLILIVVLEIGVAFLQAFVFTILVCIYLSDSVNEVKH